MERITLKKKYAIIQKDGKNYLIEKEVKKNLHIYLPISIYNLVKRKYQCPTELITKLLKEHYIKEGELIEDGERIISEVSD